MAPRTKAAATASLTAGLAKPAQRALAGAGIKNLEQLAKKPEDEIAAPHGMGPNALLTLRKSLASKGLAFARRKSG